MNLRGAAIALVVALLLPSPALSNDWVSLHEAFYKAHLNDVAVDNPVVFAILNAAMVDGEATARYLGSQQSANDFANLLREIGAYGVTVPIGVEVRGSTGLEFLGNGVTGQATAGIRVDMLRAL